MRDSSELIMRSAEPIDGRGETGDPDPVVRLRYLPPRRLGGWDLRYESGIDHLIYMQSLIEEE